MCLIPGGAPGVVPNTVLTGAVAASPPTFSFWNGIGNGSDSYWWTPLSVNANVSFKSVSPQTGDNVYVQVDWTDRHAITLFANPEYQKV